MKDTANTASAALSGRLEKPAAMTSAERTKAYRQRLKAKGQVAVKCYLPPEAMAYLGALCDIHHVTISEAVAMAVARALRGDPLPPVN